MSLAARPLAAGGHPAVTSRRIHDWLLAGAFALGAAGAALAISVAVPKPSITLALGGVVVLLFIVWLIRTPRLELTVTAVVIFLGCLNGPTKLVANAGAASSGLQDVLVLAVVLGLFFRMLAKRVPSRPPPLFGWVLAFIVLVVIEAFNPATHGLLKTLAGWRQQLQWVPFFWFGYLLIRSPQRFRRMFWILGVIALLNAFASTSQTQLTPEEVASLGSGYNNRVYGHSARKYITEGEAHVRPLGLGSDSGFSAGIGVIALPGALALVAVARRRRERWAALILALGALIGIITGLGRLQVGGAVFTIFAFIGYALIAGRRISKPILALMAVIVLALPAGVIFVDAVGSNIFSRYTSITPERFTGTATGYKSEDLLAIPKYIAAEPFGFGLGTAGAVSGFGGKSTELYEGHNINAETQYNFLVKELGFFGLAIWTGFLIRMIVLAATHIRKVVHPELEIFLIALCSPLVAFFFMSFDGPVSAGVAGGAYYWFAGGVAAYWFLGPGRKVAEARSEAPAGSLVSV
jgi:hypothetical protein